MNTDKTRQIATDAFTAWMNGTGYVSSIFADHMRWEIVGHSVASKQYENKQQFIDEVLAPFGQRFKSDAPFRPVTIRGIYADGDTAIVFWDGEGTTVNETIYRNTYSWFMTFEDGLVVTGYAFYDSISFNQLWSSVSPRD